MRNVPSRSSPIGTGLDCAIANHKGVLRFANSEEGHKKLLDWCHGHAVERPGLEAWDLPKGAFFKSRDAECNGNPTRRGAKFHPAMADLHNLIAEWFGKRGWQPRGHQLAMLEQGLAGHSALLISPTGGGKTLSGFLATLQALAHPHDHDGIHTLYISPLKALAVDIARNLEGPVAEMGLPITIETPCQ